jgi:hypothetical protein
MISVTMNHAIAALPMAEAFAPTFHQGEPIDKPRPVPSESRINDMEAKTKAPPKTAAQEMPGELSSFRAGISARNEVERSITVRETGTAEEGGIARPFHFEY